MQIASRVIAMMVVFGLTRIPLRAQDEDPTENIIRAEVRAALHAAGVTEFLDTGRSFSAKTPATSFGPGKTEFWVSGLFYESEEDATTYYDVRAGEFRDNSIGGTVESFTLVGDVTGRIADNELTIPAVGEDNDLYSVGQAVAEFHRGPLVLSVSMRRQSPAAVEPFDDPSVAKRIGRELIPELAEFCRTLYQAIPSTTASAGPMPGAGAAPGTGSPRDHRTAPDVQARPWTALDALEALKMSVGKLPMDLRLDANKDNDVTSPDSMLIQQEILKRLNAK